VCACRAGSNSSGEIIAAALVIGSRRCSGGENEMMLELEVRKEKSTPEKT